MRLLTADAVFEMPPIPNWFAGRESIGRFLATRVRRPGDMRMVPTSANGQPAFGVYMRDEEAGEYRAHAILVLTLTTAGITRTTMFQDPGLFSAFDLPDRSTAP